MSAGWSIVAPEIKRRLPYALAGGLLVGGGTAIEARVGSERLKREVAEAEAKEKSFGRDISLIKLKAQLAGRELAERHPVKAVALGTLLGAVGGAGSGPQVHKNLKSIARVMGG